MTERGNVKRARGALKTLVLAAAGTLAALLAASLAGCVKHETVAPEPKKTRSSAAFDPDDPANTAKLRDILKKIAAETSLPPRECNTTYAALFASKTFAVMAETPCEFQSYAVQLVALSDMTCQETAILTDLMMNLPNRDYVAWTEAAVRAFMDGRINACQLDRILFPAIADKPDLYLEYQDPDIADFYSRLKGNEALLAKIQGAVCKDTVDHAMSAHYLQGIDDLLSGHSARMVRERLDASCELPPPAINETKTCPGTAVDKHAVPPAAWRDKCKRAR